METINKMENFYRYCLKSDVFRDVSFVLLLLLVLVGCKDSQSPEPPQDVIWQKGIIYASGGTDAPGQEALFGRIFIGGPSSPYLDVPEIYLDFPGGKKHFLPDITIEMLEKNSYAKQTTGIATWKPTSTKRWEKGALFYNVLEPKQKGKVYVNYVYSFALIDRKVKGVIIYKLGCMGLWDAKLSKEYILPLTQSSLEELFGKPDKVTKFTSGEYLILQQMKAEGERED